jgi:hypothetical protein
MVSNRAWFGFLVAVLASCFALPAGAAQVWLSGVDPFVRHVMAPNQTSDYTQLFQTDAPWSAAAQHVQVFKSSTQFLVYGSDVQLRAMFTDLKQRHIALAVEAPMFPVGKNGCGHGTEGYAGPHEMKSVADRVKRLGGELGYVAMDEPLWFGHHSDRRGACRASIAEVAEGVATNVAAIRSDFKNVQIGDIEPFAVPGQPVDWLA